MASTGGPPSVLHLILKVQATNGQFNEHCLPLADRRAITVVSFKEPTLPCPDSIRMFAGSGSFASGWRALRRALAARRYDVVHVHAPQTGVILLAAVLLRPALLRNAVYTVQNSYANYRWRNRLLMIPIFAAYPQIVFCSDAARDSMPSWLKSLSRRKGHVVPNAVDIDAIDATIRDVDRRADGPLRVVIVGRLVPIKNIATVLSALERVTSEVRVEIVGDGVLRDELGAQVQASSVLRDRVEFVGLLERAEVHRRLAAADLYVSASFGEGLPVAVLEAMACGLPVVLSDIGPHREIGLDPTVLPLVECTDVDGFAAEVERIARLDTHGRRELGAACRRIVQQRFGLEAMHRTYVPIYERAAAAASPAPRIDLAW